MLPPNDGTPGSYELLTTSPRPDLYALLSASCTLFATTLSFVVARIRYRPRLTSAASSPRHIKLVQCLVQNVLYPCPVLVVPPFSLPLYILCVLSALLRHRYRLLSPPPIREWWPTICIILYYPLCYPLHTIGLYIQSRLQPHGDEAAHGCLVRFLASYGPVHYE